MGLRVVASASAALSHRDVNLDSGFWLLASAALSHRDVNLASSFWLLASAALSHRGVGVFCDFGFALPPWGGDCGVELLFLLE